MTAMICKKCSRMIGGRLISSRHRFMQVGDQMLYQCECGFTMLTQIMKLVDEIGSKNHDQFKVV